MTNGPANEAILQICVFVMLRIVWTDAAVSSI